MARSFARVLLVAIAATGCGVTPDEIEPAARIEPLTGMGQPFSWSGASPFVPQTGVAGRAAGMPAFAAVVTTTAAIRIEMFIGPGWNGVPFASIPVPSATGFPVLATNGGSVYAAVDTGAVVYQAPAGTSHDVSACGTGIFGLGLSSDGSRIAVGTASATCVYVLPGWTEEARFAAGPIALSPSGDRLFVGGSMLAVRVRTGTTWADEASLPNGAASAGVATDRDGSHAATVGGGELRMFSRTGTTWTMDASFTVSAGASSVALSGDGLWAFVGDDFGRRVLPYLRTATGWVADTPLTGGAMSAAARVLSVSDDGTTLVASGMNRTVGWDIRGETGDPCTVDSQCRVGSCSDGICCGTACGSSSTDCMACTVAAGGSGPDGTCSPLTATLAAATTCRPSAGGCDRPEVCTETSTDCPTDLFRPLFALCRARIGACDREELCSGTSAGCPDDEFEPSGTTCGGAGSCVSEGMCAGGPDCEGSTPLPDGEICAPADPTSPCDVDDTCDGVTDLCLPRFASATTPCGPDAVDVCDAPDHCTGTSGDCEAVFLEGVVCRPPAGSCDAAESCTGAGPSCPADLVLTAGLVCNPSTSSCDPVESCDGVSTACPRDVDCSTDAGGPSTDAGAPPAPSTGCSCRASGTPRPAGLLGLVMVALVVRRRLRR